jgi:hypothetical protein
MMNLQPNGIDVFYIDESERFPLSVASAVRIPLLRPNDNGWRFIWDEYLTSATRWRRDVSRYNSIRFREELHANKLIGRSGLYHKTWRNLTHEEAAAVYKNALATLTWLPERSIMSAFSNEKSKLMGHEGIAACLFGLFQRIRNHCQYTKVNGLIFFDEGHSSYIRLYRMAQKYLPTGSAFGGWGSGKTKNLPLSMFPLDGDIKNSHLSYFVQIADLICYAARLKIEHETNRLSVKRTERGHHMLYGSLPKAQLNSLATFKRPDAIVPT